MKVETGRFLHQTKHDGLPQQLTPQGLGRPVNHDMSDAMCAGKFKQRGDRILRAQANHFGAQLPRLLLGIHQPTLRFGIDFERILFGLEI